MNYQLTNDLLWIGTYIAYTIWAILACVLFVAISRRKWETAKRTLKYILNTVVFLIAFMFILELALLVRPAFYETREASISALRSLIASHLVKDTYVALITVAVLFGINLLFHFKLEHKMHSKDLVILTLFDIFVLAFGIWLAGQSAYFGLMQEINRHFG